MRIKTVRPVLILAATFLVILMLFLGRRTPEENPKSYPPPLVRVAIGTPTSYQFSVPANGSVSPRTETDLIPQVSGEVISMSPALVAGGFFVAGVELARIDGADYRVNREATRAQVARAESDYARAEKELSRQSRLATQSVASESRIDDAENAYRVAEASLREAEARLERAERDLARTRILAPYRGRVRSEQIDLGQFVDRGQAIATVYAVDFAEVRLPIPDRELAFLDVPLTHGTTTAESAELIGPKVLISADFAGGFHEWEGRLVRSEAELDPRSRMVHLVARVADPFGLSTPRSAPLAIGLFVDAVITGQTAEGAFLLPRDSLRPNSQVFIVDAENRIHFRDVTLLRAERDQIVIGSGLEAGDRVCTSPLDAAIEGMLVRVVGSPTPEAFTDRPDQTVRGNESRVSKAQATPEAIQ